MSYRERARQIVAGFLGRFVGAVDVDNRCRFCRRQRVCPAWCLRRAADYWHHRLAGKQVRWGPGHKVHNRRAEYSAQTFDEWLAEHPEPPPPGVAMDVTDLVRTTARARVGFDEALRLVADANLTGDE